MQTKNKWFIGGLVAIIMLAALTLGFGQAGLFTGRLAKFGIREMTRFQPVKPIKPIQPAQPSGQRPPYQQLPAPGTVELAVQVSPILSAIQVVPGQFATLGSWDFTVGSSSEPISLNSVIIDDNTAGIGRNFQNLELWIDGAKRSLDTGATVFPSTIAQTITFILSPQYSISSTSVVEVKGKVKTAPADSQVIMQIAAGGVSGYGDITSTPLTNTPPSAVNGQTIIINQAGTLSVSRDIVTNVKESQIVAGTTNVTFAAFKFQADAFEDIRITKITLVGTSTTSGITNIGIYDGISPINGVILSGVDQNNSAVFDYSARPFTIPANSSKVLTVKADTLYSAPNGQKIQFAIGSIEAKGLSSGELINSIYAYYQTADNIKIIYPTKLNFAWVPPASSTLSTGGQIEVARFTMGADPADVNNPQASVSVTALNFTNLSTAYLTNFKLNDFIRNVNLVPFGRTGIDGATSSLFNITPQGGFMQPITFKQGETRIFRILADVSTSAGSQTAQFRFNAGGYDVFLNGSATWDVTNNGVAKNSRWTVLAGDAYDVSSTTLTSATTGSDTQPPSITKAVVNNGGMPGSIDAGDRIMFEFSEKIDPVSINPGLFYGGQVYNLTYWSTGSMTASVAGSTINVDIRNIARVRDTFTVPPTPSPVASSTTSISLHQDGTKLIVVFDTVNGGTGTTKNSASQVLTGGSVGTSTAIKDIAGNPLSVTTFPVLGAF